MKDKLLQIINHYGINNQQRKLQEEIFELQEAINIHELKESVEYEIPLTEIYGTKKHLTEEIGDVIVLIKQIQLYYEIPTEEVKKIIEYKVNRQIERIDSETI